MDCLNILFQSFKLQRYTSNNEKKSQIRPFHRFSVFVVYNNCLILNAQFKKKVNPCIGTIQNNNNNNKLDLLQLNNNNLRVTCTCTTLPKRHNLILFNHKSVLHVAFDQIIQNIVCKLALYLNVNVSTSTCLRRAGWTDIRRAVCGRSKP